MIFKSIRKKQVANIVLHVGPPKSGTSAIQYFLHSNNKLLEKHGFFYPEHDLDKNNISGGHTELGLPLTENNLEQAKITLEKFLATAREKKLDLLLSAESFYINSEKMKKLLVDFDGSVTIIAFFRDPLETIYSSYSQIIKRHFYKGTFEEHFKKVTGGDGGYFSGKILQKWIEHFGANQCKIHPYDFNTFINDRIELSFLSLLNIDNKHFPSFSLGEEKINKSYTSSALELKRIINAALTEKDIVPNANIDRALQYFSDNSQETRLDYREILTEQQRTLIQDKFSSSNKLMLATLYKTPSDGYLNYNSTHHSIQSKSSIIEYSLSSVFSQALGRDAAIVEFLSKRVGTLLKRSPKNTSLLMLAEILKIGSNYQPYSFFSHEQLKKITAPDASQFTIYLNLALALEKKNHIDEAFQMAERALQLRPNGQVIKTLYARLSHKKPTPL
ncbi:hypothetical protein [Zobellella endophytica]|uniref:hypothetical protein n=1 Tax=Zobellella endophytica TaxID=2116700 RepID=UPI0011B27FB5|nr:hypothetical protein [Zobellella endophytica]